MDGENNGKPYFLMDDLGGKPYFWKHPFHCFFGAHFESRPQPRNTTFRHGTGQAHRTQWPMGQGKKNAEKTRMGPGGWWRVSSI